MNNTIKKYIKAQFLNLVQINSASGNEKQVGNYILNNLKDLGMHVSLDHSGKLNDSNFGNVIAYYSRSKKKNIYVTHMDTVENIQDKIRPKLVAGIFKSEGETILGADNKASIAVLLAVAKFEKEKLKRGNIFIFTTREEQGEMGSQYIDINKYQPKYIFNIDGSAPIGTVDLSSLGVTGFEIEIRGKAAHAAIEPEKGINALIVANKFISKLLIGKQKDGSTLNIGTVICKGPTNVIPSLVKIVGETRSYSSTGISHTIKQIKNHLKDVCQESKASFKITILYAIPPFIESTNVQIRSYVEKAIRNNGITPVFQKAPYTSDASYLSQHKIPVLTLCKGGLRPHTIHETISLNEMIKLYNIISDL